MREKVWTRKKILDEIRYMKENNIKFEPHSKKEYKPGISPAMVYNAAQFHKKEYGFVKNGRFIGKRGLELLAVGESNAPIQWTRDQIINEIKYMHEHNIKFTSESKKRSILIPVTLIFLLLFYLLVSSRHGFLHQSL